MKPKENATDRVMVNGRIRVRDDHPDPAALSTASKQCSGMLGATLSDSCWPLGPYLDHGTHDLPGLVVELVSTPAGVQAPQFGGQPIVFSHKEGMQGRQLGGFT